MPTFVSQLTHLNGQNVNEHKVNPESDESNDSINPEIVSLFKKHGMSRKSAVSKKLKSRILETKATFELEKVINEENNKTEF